MCNINLVSGLVRISNSSCYTKQSLSLSNLAQSSLVFTVGIVGLVNQGLRILSYLVVPSPGAPLQFSAGSVIQLAVEGREE